MIRTFLSAKKIVAFLIVQLTLLLGIQTVMGQVTTINDWTNEYHGTSTATQNINYTIPEGTNNTRLLVVGIATTTQIESPRTVVLTYGGQTLTPVNGNIDVAVRQHTQLYYLDEAGLDAASNTTLSVRVYTGNTVMTDVFAAVFDNVEQTTPITDYQTYSYGTSQIRNFQFATGLTINANDLALKILSSVRPGSTTTRNISNFGTNWTANNQQTGSYNTSPNSSDLGIRQAVGKRTIPGGDITDVSATFMSGNSLISMTGMSLKYNLPKYFRSLSSGSWNNTSTWQQSTNGTTWVAATSTPTSLDNSITIRSPHIVTVTAPVAVDEVTVNAGGQITVNSGQTFTIADGSGVDLSVNGRVVNSGTITTNGTIEFNSSSNYEHAQNGGIIPTATWHAGSVLKVTGITTTMVTLPNDIGGNVEWNCPGQTVSGNIYTSVSGGATFSVGGDFTVTSTGTGLVSLFELSGQELNIGGSYIQTNGNLTIEATGNSDIQTINIGENFSLSGGILDFSSNTNNTINLNVAGNWSHSAGTLTETSTGIGNVVFNETTTQTYQKTGGTISNTIHFSVNSGSTLDVGTSVIDGSTGTFTLSSGAGIITAHAQGLSTSASTGSIQVTGARSYSNLANYEFKGASTGVFATTPATPIANTVNSLTINQANGVSLSQSLIVSGILNLANGILTTDANFVILTNNSTSAVIGGSSTNFVNGPIVWLLATGQTYSFPVGKGATYLPFGISGLTGTAPVIMVEAFLGNAGGSATAPLSSLSNTEYWLASVPQGTYTNGSVSLTRPTAAMGAIGRSATQTGDYVSLDGTVSGNSINNSVNTGNTLGYFLMASKNSITTGTISPTSYCPGSTISVPYTIMGTYTSGNIFTAQLSDASGNFSSPVNIGTLPSTAGGIISATIPAGTTPSTGYRIRVVSSAPARTGSDNGSNVTINTIAFAPLATGSLVCVGSTATLSASGAVTGDVYKWYNAASGGTLLKTSTNNSDNIYTTTALIPTTNYWVSILSAGGCESARTLVTATYPSVSTDDQNAAATNSWVSHVYDETNQGVLNNGNFANYYGSYTEPEMFDQSFGGNTNCFSINSNSSSPNGRSIHAETFSVRYRMNSTKRGLYIADLGADDGTRLTVDGTLLYNNWSDQAFTSRPRVLMSLNGSSSLVYDFYENGGGNQVVFQNLTPVLSNSLTSNATQNICLGNSGLAISGDVYGTLPTGITLFGTGYQWTYSATPGGVRTPISGATAATFTPNTTVAPFNAAGTYYIFRNAVLSSANNTGVIPYVATNESNVATITVNTLPVATFSYAGTPYCKNASNPLPTFEEGGVAGTFSSLPAGLNFVSTATGQVNLATSAAGTYTITNTIAAAGGCGIVTATSPITITAMPIATFNYTGTPYCKKASNPLPTFSGGGVAGTFSSSPAGLNFVSTATGQINLATSAAGTYTITNTIASANGCGIVTAGSSITINQDLPVSILVTTSANPVCVGTSVTFTAIPTNGGAAPSYQWKVNGINAGTNSSTYTYTPSDNDLVTCILTSNAICAIGSPATSNSITMTISDLIGNNRLEHINGSHGVICSTVNENGTVTLAAPAGTIFTHVGFASYGLPNGTCPDFTLGTCHALTSQSVSESYLLDKTSASIPATNAVFGDPCVGTVKRLYVLATYTEPICMGGTPGTITGTVPTGGNETYTYFWESSTIGSSTGFAAAAGTNNLKDYTPGPLTQTTWFRRTVTSGGCSDISTVLLIKVNPVLAGNTVSSAQTICSGTAPISLTGALPTGGSGSYIYSWESSTTSATTGFAAASGPNDSKDYTPDVLTQTTWYRRNVASGGCSNTSTAIQLTVTPIPEATFSYADSPYCQNGANPTPAFIGGGVAGTFSSSPTGLNFVSTASGQVNLASSTPGTYIITNTIASSGGCGIVTATSSITITALPVATISYSGTSFCKSVAVAQAVTRTGTGGGTYSAPPGLTINTSTGAITPSTSTAGTYTVTYTVASEGGCGIVTVTTSVTITAVPTATISYSGTPFCKSISLAQAVTLNGTGAYIGGIYSAPSGLSINASTGVITPSASTAGTYTVTYTIPSTGGCPAVPVTTTVTITTLPVATFSYAGSPYCSSSANPLPTFSGDGVAGTFSSTTGLVFVNAATGQVNIAASTAGTYTVTNAIAAAGGCGIVMETTLLTIVPDGSWTGYISTDWNNPGNWACNQLPTLTSNVLVANGKPHYPILSGGDEGLANNLTIENAGSLTVTGNAIQIAGILSNNGSFTASAGTIAMKGSVAQIIGANVFAGNAVMNLTADNPAGVTLQGALNVTGIVRALNGNLTSGGHLTLVSTATQTALIDGIGTGDVLGDVTIQRYLPSAFGYKYFSSPFQSATVNELAQEVDLGNTFPSFYKYDENNGNDSLGIIVYRSGWVKYINSANALVPLAGYAANLGANSAAPAIIANMTGVVNNGNLQVSLYNHNRKYTKGFSLVGNPYPSPIDWNATGWTKTHIDNALYFFNASGSQYAGTYSSYVNGVSTGNGSNVIAAMQGFFVHVSDGTYPVSGTLGVTNSVRINNLNPVFKRANIDNRSILRFTASFDHKNAIEDAAVIYFDNAANLHFDQDLDALKISNTDQLVPNIYSLTPEWNQLSINGMPLPLDSISKIPLGISIFTDGWITLKADDISQLPAGMHIYLLDAETGLQRNLKQFPDYRFYLKSGQYNGRFNLVFSLSELSELVGFPGKLFTLFRSGDYLRLKANLPENTRGNLMVTNLLGQIILRREVVGNETVEINQNVNAGVYVITLISGKLKHSEKVIMRKNYE